MKNKKKLFWLILPFTLIMFALLFALYPTPWGAKEPHKVFHSPEKHLKEVEKRVNQKIEEREMDYTNLRALPLYDEYNKFSFVPVEFEPQDFMILKVYRTSIISVKRTIYLRDTNNSFGVHTENNENSQFNPYQNCDTSNNKLYFLKANNGKIGGYIPAIKTEDKYINLMSNETMELDYYNYDTDYANLNISYLAKRPLYF